MPALTLAERTLSGPPHVPHRSKPLVRYVRWPMRVVRSSPRLRLAMRACVRSQLARSTIASSGYSRVTCSDSGRADRRRVRLPGTRVHLVSFHVHSPTYFALVRIERTVTWLHPPPCLPPR